MKDKDELLLNKYGWFIECEHPFEMSHEETGSFATNLSSEIILKYYKDLNKKSKGKNGNSTK